MKLSWRKILFVGIWLGIGSGILVLLLAANQKRKQGVCTGYSITVTGAEQNLFLDDKDVERLLSDAQGGAMKGMAVTSFNLHRLEQLLEQQEWVRQAELYFDSHDFLHVTVTEREPVARVFQTDGQSFYIDSAACRLPLSDKLSARVPVFTGFPAKKTWDGADSLLLRQVKTTAVYILSDPFWTAQVAQIDITPERHMEMIPVVGNHLVRLGSGENIAAKFGRLMVFYRQVLAKAGMDKYRLIDVQYKGQVVASRYNGQAGVDSVQLRRNVEKLLKQSLQSEADTVAKSLPATATLVNDNEGELQPGTDELPVKKTAEPAGPVPPKENKAEGKNGQGTPAARPKAVMPPRQAVQEDHGYN